MIKGREPAYQPYNYLTRLRAPLVLEAGQRLVAAIFETEDAVLQDEERQLSFSYHAVGSLTVYWREKEMQWLAAPLNCTSMVLDPVDGRLYLEAAGFVFVYGR